MTAAVGAPASAAVRRSSGRTLGRIGVAVLALLVAIALFAPLLARHRPLGASGLPYQSPTAAHPLGTDDVGQDIFSQLVYGSRVSLAIGLLSALFAVSLGLTVAVLAGYFRGAVDTTLMRVVDLTLAFPFLPLVLVLAAFLGRGLLTTVIVIGAVLWARPARVLRSHVLRVVEFHHVQAARAMGSSTPRILARHVMPRTAPLAAAQFVRAANVAVLIEASLAFLGLGDPRHVTLGTMLFFANSHSAFLTGAWVWWILPPGLALTAAIVGFACLGYAIEEWSDPRLAGTADRPTRRSGRDRDRPGPVPGAPDAPVLEVRDLVVEYQGNDGPVRAVNGVDFSIDSGQIVGLIGESGSGKTTVAMALLGLLRRPGRVVSGTVVLRGREMDPRDPRDLADVRGRDIAFVPQSASNALNPAYTVHRQVTEAASLGRDPAAARARATELLGIVGIPEHRHGAYPHELSGGMRQRVVIAMALANQPALLIADEPVTGLDVLVQGRILRLLIDLQERFRLSMLLISHDLPMVGHVADHLLVMHEGEIVERGPTARVTAQPEHPYTQLLLAGSVTLDSRRPSEGNGQRGARQGAARDGEALVELRGVSKTFTRRTFGRANHGRQAVTAVHDVDLEVAPGEIVAVVGESGAGKSTLGRIVLGLERPDDGEVRFCGSDLNALSPQKIRAVRQRMHLVFQDPYQSLHPGMRVGQVVAEPLAIGGVSRAGRVARVAQALVDVDLRPPESFLGRFPHQLSGGQRQRVAFARAVVGRPRLIVADEPTSMLDVSVRAGILELMLKLRDLHGVAFLLVTHDLAVARLVSDRIGVMLDGRLVEVGPADQVVGHPHHPYTRALLRAVREVVAPSDDAGPGDDHFSPALSQRGGTWNAES